jgi:thioredoxin reductase
MYDIAIIGAGPAGMEAALLARRYTEKIIVLDARPEPGGNIYAYVKSNARNFPENFQKFDQSYQKGLPLVERFLACGIDYRPCSSVWHLEANGQLAFRGPDGAGIIEAKKVLLCTGAYERPLAVPGWTLPGVMGVGAAQIALKSSAVLPESPTVIIGDGPLTLLYARQLRRAGGRISTVIIPQKKAGPAKIGSGMRASMINPAKTVQGLSLLLDRARAGTEIARDALKIEIMGRNRVEGVCYELSGRRVDCPAGSVLLHDGIIPDINIQAGAGLEVEWSANRQYWHPLLDTMGQSSFENIWVAGDAGGIAGAGAAHLSGQRAAMAACVSLGFAPESEAQEIIRKTGSDLKREQLFNSVMESLYPSAFQGRSYPDHLTVCRCEGVTAGDIRREIATLHNTGVDPNRLKSALRCGMGPCQGRNCSLTVANIIAGELGTEIDAQSLVRTRAPYTQVTLGELAGLGDPEASS